MTSTDNTTAVSTAKREAAWLRSVWRQAPKRMLWVLLAPLLSGIVFIVQAYYLAHLLQLSIVDKVAVAQLAPVAVGVAALLLLRVLLVWSGELVASSASEHIKHQLRQRLFATWLVRGPAWSKNTPSGELSTSIVDYVEALDGYIQRYLSASVAAVFLPLLLAFVAFGVDWIVGLLFLFSAPLIPFFMALVGWGAEAANAKYHQRLQQLTGVFADRIQGLFTLTLFGRASDEVHKVREASVVLGQTTMKVLRIAFLSSAVLELFAALGVAGVAVYVGLGYLGMLGSGFSGVSLQQGLFCLFLAPEVYQPLRQMAASYHDRAQAKSAVSQLTALYQDLPPLSLAQPITAQFQPCFQRVEPTPDNAVLWVENVQLYTPDQQRLLLTSTSFTLRAGDAVALQGISGSGKSTLLETLAGLRPYQHGKVYYAATSATAAMPFLVGAHVPVLSGTVADALRYAAPHASDDALWAALERVALAHSLRAEHQGLATRLGVRGYGLSGGQLQRLVLARLFLSDPDVVLLDEPTAHLDAHTRDHVLAEILAFCRGRTLVVATHDPEVSRQFPRCWLLREQRLHEVQP